MKLLLPFAFLTFLVIAAAPKARAQQAGAIDLRPHRASPNLTTNSSDDPTKVPECDKLSLGYADGFTEPPDHKMRSIDVSVVQIGTTQLAIGSEVEGTVKLQNSGEIPVEIPWSTDFNTTIRGQDPHHLVWESGEFHLKLTSGKKRGFELANLSWLLYSSRLVPGSELTIRPGQWISAQIKFRVDTPNKWQHVDEGDFNLHVEWFQIGRGRNVRECSGFQGFFPFRNYYQQTQPEIPVRVIQPTPPKADDTTKNSRP